MSDTGDRRRARSRALHRAVAARLLEDPERALALAHRQLARTAADPHARYYVDEWTRWLARPVPEICRLLADDDSEYAEALRRMSPFVGVLTQAERAAIYRRYAVDREEPPVW
ncbi:MAG: hypothetical protein ACP5QO_11390 [Clostridia bacterium]